MIAKPGDVYYEGMVRYLSHVPCFLCGDSTKDEPVIHWSGFGGFLDDEGMMLVLHAGCAGSFVLRLARDAWEAENKKGDGKLEFKERR